MFWGTSVGHWASAGLKPDRCVPVKIDRIAMATTSCLIPDHDEGKLKV